MSRVNRIPLLLIFLALGCTTEIHHDLEEPQANSMLVALGEAGIAGDKIREGRGKNGWTVRVPRGDAQAAFKRLAELELPREEPAGLEQAYGEPSLIPTPTEERARYLAALGGELSRTLEAIDGVIDARVHVVQPSKHPLSRNEEPEETRASALIKYRPGPDGKPPCNAVEVIKLVSSGVEGLPEHKVNVIFTEARDAPAAGTEAGLVLVAGLGMTHGSAAAFRIGLVIVCVALVGLALALVLSRLALRRARNSENG